MAVRRFDGDGVVQRTISSIAAGKPRRVVAQRAHLIGMLEQRQQAARDRVARGLGARAEQQAEEQVQLEVGERGRIHVVEGGVGDDGQHVVGRLGPLRRRSAPARRRTSATRLPRPTVARLPDLGLPRAAEVELRLDRLEQPMPFGLGHSQQDADHLHRQLGRDVDQEVERHPGLDGVEQARARARRSSSTVRIIRGVSPELTSRRTAECRGSSIMLST